MDCRIIDCIIVVTDGSVVSVAPNHFGQADRSDCYFGRVVRIVHDKSAKIKWFEDDIRDLYVKDFISTCSTSIPGKLRSAKYHELVNRP